MKIGIIGAMKEEIDVFCEEMVVSSKLEKASMTFYEGVLLGHNVVMVVSGIGKVNAAICTQILVERFSIDCIINIGVAGGLHKNVRPGDMVVADSLFQHDVDVTAFGYKKGQVPRMDTIAFPCDENLVQKALSACKTIDNINTFKGPIASGDQFLGDAKIMEEVHNTFGAFACEMEGASIGQVCYLNQMPCVVIRSISDNAITGDHMDYDTFSKMAIENAVFVLRNMLSSLS